MEEMKAISHARMEMDKVASANGSPRMLLGRKLAIVKGEIGRVSNSRCDGEQESLSQ